jgi:hypothetical protein
VAWERERERKRAEDESRKIEEIACSAAENLAVKKRDIIRYGNSFKTYSIITLVFFTYFVIIFRKLRL